MKRIIQFIILAVATITLLRSLDFMLLSLRWPLSICMDASIVRFEAWSWLRGDLPWRDVVSINLPMTHYVHIFGLWLLGADDLAFRLYDVLWIGVLGGSFYVFVRKQVSPSAFVLGLAFLSLLPIEATPFGAFQRDMLLIPFWLIGGYFIERDSRTLRTIGGVLLVASVWIKPTSILFILLYLLALYFFERRSYKTFRNYFNQSIPIAVGSLLGTFLILLPLMIQGLLNDFVQSWIIQTSAYTVVTETKSMGSLISNLFTFDFSHWNIPLSYAIDQKTDTGHLGWFSIVTLIAYVFLVVKRPDYWRAIPFLLGGFLSFVLQQRGFQYHLYPLFVAHAIALVYLFHFLFDFWNRKSFEKHRGFLYNGTLYNGIFLGFILLFLVTSVAFRQNAALKVYKGTGLLQKDGRHPINDFKVVDEIGKLVYLTGKKQPSIQIFEHASIALGSVMRYNLRLSSKYVVDYILWDDSPYREAAQKELLSNLKENPPDIIAFSSGHPRGFARLKQFKELEKFIANKYLLHQTILEENGDYYRLYQRSP